MFIVAQTRNPTPEQSAIFKRFNTVMTKLSLEDRTAIFDVITAVILERSESSIIRRYHVEED
jgi:hypothetical protein